MTDTNEKAAVYVDLKDLIPWDKNPRINAAAVQKVETSIRRFGFAAPIVARKQDSMIIAGHTRWKALHNITEYMTGDKKVPVRFMDISKEEAEKLALADNKLNEIALWDDDGLKDILADMDTETALDLGWDENELKNLFLDKEFGINDPNEEWVDMPEFEGEDISAYKKLIVNFENEEDYQKFADLIDQKLTDKTKSIYFPEYEYPDIKNVRY
jgi:ParB-like chromosome segregation protein Spo0J